MSCSRTLCHAKELGIEPPTYCMWQVGGQVKKLLSLSHSWATAHQKLGAESIIIGHAKPQPMNSNFHFSQYNTQIAYVPWNNERWQEKQAGDMMGGGQVENSLNGIKHIWTKQAAWTLESNVTDPLWLQTGRREEERRLHTHTHTHAHTRTRAHARTHAHTHTRTHAHTHTLPVSIKPKYTVAVGHDGVAVRYRGTVECVWKWKFLVMISCCINHAVGW